MYIVNQDENDLKKIEPITFSEAGFKERQNLQEWIAKNPNCLSEELLIIQKEFAGFDDTKERLDLLALDKDGNLVVIENKLDGSGKDVVWQSLKYVSYCSSLSSKDIEQIFQEFLIKNNKDKTAREVLIEFFDNEDYDEILNSGYSQRIVLVAGNFRKEVTSTVMWLLNNGIDISCFKVTPYKMESEFILDFNQIIPLKEAEEYIIKVAEKQKEEVINKRLKSNRMEVYEKFWVDFLDGATKKTNLVENNNPVKNSWIRVGIGMSGVSLNLVISKNYARSEIYINRKHKELNKETFDSLYKNKEGIESELDKSLEWERLDDRVTSRIKLQMNDVDISNKDDYIKMINFLTESMVKMHKTFKPHISKLSR